MDDPTKMCLYHTGIEEKIDALCSKIDDRDRGYHEREVASKEAIKAAFNAAEKAAEKTEFALKEYKVSANEWRDTVKDLVNRMITRPDVERELKVLDGKISDLRAEKERREGKETGKKTGTMEIITMINLVFGFIAAISIIIHMMRTGG